jgi:hypothetical protein
MRRPCLSRTMDNSIYFYMFDHFIRRVTRTARMAHEYLLYRLH